MNPIPSEHIQPFLLKPAHSINPNVSHSCFIFSVLHYQRDIIWILFLGRFHHIDVFKFSPCFPVVVSNVPRTSGFIISHQSESWQFHMSTFGVMIGDITIMQHDTYKELYRVYGLYMSLYCFYGSELVKHTIFNQCIPLQLDMAASKKCLSKPKSFPAIYFRGFFT